MRRADPRPFGPDLSEVLLLLGWATLQPSLEPFCDLLSGGRMVYFGNFIEIAAPFSMTMYRPADCERIHHALKRHMRSVPYRRAKLAEQDANRRTVIRFRSA
jgi:hypothetical protein